MKNNRQTHVWLAVCMLLILGCSEPTKENLPNTDISLRSSHPELVETFDWAKEKARLYVQTGKQGPVDVWEKGEGTGEVAYIPSYWAGYPGRSAFYSRDFCHQWLGAHLLGLEEENFTMLKAFAASADEEKKWFPLWAINFDGSMYKLDYRGDDDFVREVPATFELVERAYDLYLWTGDERYIHDDILWNFYSKAVSDFVDFHDIQLSNGVAEGTGKGIFDGAASYNEQRDHPLIESGDGIASQYKAFDAYSKMAALRGETELAEAFAQKTADLFTYFNQEWGIKGTDTYNRGYLANGEAVEGWGKENSWFMPMKGITEGGSERTDAYLDFIQERLESKDDIPDNIEAVSYLPETFFLHHQNERGWNWMQHIMAGLTQEHAHAVATGRNGDYPEVSYVLIQNFVKDLLGLSPNASAHTIATLSHLPEDLTSLSIEHIPIGDALFSISHKTDQQSMLRMEEGEGTWTWKAGFAGIHDALFVNGVKQVCMQGLDQGLAYSWCVVEVKKGERVVVSLMP